MGKNLTPKIILIVLLTAGAAWVLYPPSQTLKPGIDLAGGTSLIYEIDTHGLESAAERKDLASRMITVLRKRIDPANIQNLVWRPQGNTRFEIQMPLASAEARQKRVNYEQAETAVLEKNVSAAKVLRSLDKPAQERAELFASLALADPNRQKILDTLATASDERKNIRTQRDELYNRLGGMEAKLSAAGLNLDRINQSRNEWVKLPGDKLQEALKAFTDANDARAVLSEYAKTYIDWSKAADQYLQKDEQYKQARATIDRLNLTQDQLNSCLELPEKSPKRDEQILKLKTEFPDRAEEIDRAVVAFDEYRPFRGRLDDPKDLQRMLKGAGILEFRILPTLGHPEVDTDQMNTYVERLKEKGPQYASDTRYVWCEIENIDEWHAADAEERPTVVAQFGEKWYVLASNQTNETMLHGSGRTDWKLDKSYPTTDEIGRRAIGFLLDDRGGMLFSNVTGKNIDRPLCILLDGIAISAPNIQTRISKQGHITGAFTQTQVEDMVNKLNAGSLPARLVEQPISVNTIGPSIGEDNRDQGIRAGLIGLAGVIACMAIYYLVGGAIADTALLLNLLFVLAIMAALRATFTLPGIAGVILTIGMSVDANVLIFERIREEQQRGASLRIAIKNGYERAFSAIFDSNLTTVLSAAILYWVASEDIKGFAITLMLGLCASMFTALFVTRVTFDWLLFSRASWKAVMSFLTLTGTILSVGIFLADPIRDLLALRQPVLYFFVRILYSVGLGYLSGAILTVAYWFLPALAQRHIKNRLMMLHLIRKPNINWMALRPAFLVISGVLTIGGLIVFFTRDDTKNNKYDIEFTGGTSAQINLKEPMSRQEVEDKISPHLPGANVYSIGTTSKQYEITTTETNKTSVAVTLSQAGAPVQELIAQIEKAQAQFLGTLTNLMVTQDPQTPAKITVSTSQMNQALIKDVLAAAFPQAQISEPQADEVVNKAIMAAFSGQLEIQENLQPKIISEQKISEEQISSFPELIDYLGGVKIVCEVERAVPAGEIMQRFRDLPFKPDMRNVPRYPYGIVDASLGELADPNQPIKSFAYVSAQPDAAFRELTEDEWTRFVDTEKSKVMGATQLETSLPRVNQISPSVGAEARTRALIAIVLSLAALLAYIWVRFGNMRYGVGAVITLFHDTCATLGAVTACTYIAGTFIGQKLLIGDFKIDLTMIAAFLTLIGYSLNDSIVIYDRIRENRRKGTLTPQIISNSINDTLSRTLLTGITTLLVVLTMYIFGGSRLRGFNFALLFGLVVGTYSSIAISAPILLIGAKGEKEKGR